MKPSVFFSFMDCVFGVISKKLSHTQGHLSLLLFSSRSFIVLSFTFKSPIHFVLIFVKSIKSGSGFIFFCMWMSNFSSTICWKEHLCSIVLPLLLCQRQVDYIYGGLFLGYQFCPTNLFIWSFTNTTLSWLL